MADDPNFHLASFGDEFHQLDALASNMQEQQQHSHQQQQQEQRQQQSQQEQQQQGQSYPQSFQTQDLVQGLVGTTVSTGVSNVTLAGVLDHAVIGGVAPAGNPGYLSHQQHDVEMPLVQDVVPSGADLPAETMSLLANTPVTLGTDTQAAATAAQTTHMYQVPLIQEQQSTLPQQLLPVQDVIPMQNEEESSTSTATPAIINPSTIPREPPSSAAPAADASAPATSPAAKTTGRRGSRKKKDPNAPAAVSSAYILFMKETQATVKEQNPNVEFGALSKIIGSMWQALPEEERAVYKKKNEDDKKRFEREMAEYRAKQEAERASSETATNGTQNSSRVHEQAPPAKDSKDSSSEEEENRCIREGCNNKAVQSVEWEDEYCSNLCVVEHCKNVFKGWTLNQMAM